jgi:hypothetical protein
MKTILMTLLAATAATTLVTAADQLPTTSTRKQAQDAGEKPFLPDASTTKGAGRFNNREATRKQGLNAGTLSILPESKATRDENKAEDRNREVELRQLRPDGAADAPTPAR